MNTEHSYVNTGPCISPTKWIGDVFCPEFIIGPILDCLLLNKPWAAHLRQGGRWG